MTRVTVAATDTDIVNEAATGKETGRAVAMIDSTLSMKRQAWLGGWVGEWVSG